MDRDKQKQDKQRKRDKYKDKEKGVRELGKRQKDLKRKYIQTDGNRYRKRQKKTGKYRMRQRQKEIKTERDCAKSEVIEKE